MSDRTRKVVVALNGFLGDRRGQLDVGEIVNARAIMCGVPFYTRRNGAPEHGGWRPFSKRRLRRWIDEHLNAGFGMLFVGKSYGAHWIVDFFQEKDIARDSHALLFDPAHTLTRGEGKSRTVAYPERVTVVRQLGFRSGYRVEGATDIVVKAKHKNIESRRSALLQLQKFLDIHLGNESEYL